MHNIIKILLIITIFTLSSCNSKNVKFFRKGHTMDDFKDELESSDPDFKLGWDHGCETGSATGSNQFYKMFYDSNKQDGWKMAESPIYNKAWKYGFWYCYREEYVDQKSLILPIFGGIR